MKNYGKELILDIHEVKNTNLFNRENIEKFMVELCDLIDMEREDLHFWDELYTPEKDKFKEEHLIGTSAIQFITTSNITIHTLDVMRRCYINVFTCKSFSVKNATRFCVEYFDGKLISKQVIDRI